jgi:hypothetical protein
MARFKNEVGARGVKETIAHAADFRLHPNTQRAARASAGVVVGRNSLES